MSSVSDIRLDVTEPIFKTEYEISEKNKKLRFEPHNEAVTCGAIFMAVAGIVSLFKMLF